MTEALGLSPEGIAKKMRIPAPVSEEDLDDIRDAIADAVAVVENHLHRPLTPTVKTRRASPVETDLTSWKAWRFDEDDDVTIVSAQPVGDGSGQYDVVYTVGIVLTPDHPIARFLRRQTIEDLTHNPTFPWGQRVVRTLSAEGQSVTYEGRAAEAGQVGAQPTLASLDEYKRVSLYRAPGTRYAPWPMTSAPVGWDPT